VVAVVGAAAAAAASQVAREGRTPAVALGRRRLHRVASN